MGTFLYSRGVFRNNQMGIIFTERFSKKLSLNRESVMSRTSLPVNGSCYVPLRWCIFGWKFIFRLVQHLPAFLSSVKRVSPSSPLFTQILENKNSVKLCQTIARFFGQSRLPNAGRAVLALPLETARGGKSSSNVDPDLAKIVVDRRGHPLNTIFFACIFVSTPDSCLSLSELYRI